MNLKEKIGNYLFATDIKRWFDYNRQFRQEMGLCELINKKTERGWIYSVSSCPNLANLSVLSTVVAFDEPKDYWISIIPIAMIELTRVLLRKKLKNKMSKYDKDKRIAFEAEAEDYLKSQRGELK